MADAAGLILSCGELVAKLYDYAKAVNSAQKDILALNGELLALSGLLNDASTRLPELADSKAFCGLLVSARRILDEIAHYLEVPTVKSKRLWQSLKWPTRQEDVAKLMLRLRDVRDNLMLCILTDSSAATASIEDELRDFHHEYRLDQDAAKQASREAARREVRHSLAGPISQQKKLRDMLRARHRNTGLWFLEGRHFRSWLLDSSTQTPRVLLVVGKSGAGKTSLVSSAINAALNAASDGQTTVAAYCLVSFNEPSSQDALAVLRILVSQLSEAFPELLQGLTQESMLTGELTLDSLGQRLSEALQASDKTVHILVDAVNESRDPDAMLECLLRLVDTIPRLRLLLTSTATDDAISQMSRCNPPEAVVVPMYGNADDLRLFIDAELDSRRSLRRLPAELKAEISHTLARKSEGMFRYTQCQLAHLAAQPTGKLVRAALHDLPADINATYTQLLLRIPPNVRDLAREALLWLTFVYRPLTLDALAEALAFEVGDADVDEAGLCDPADILRWFGGIVAPASGDSDAITLAHSSVRTFLLGDPIRHGPAAPFALDQRAADTHLMRKCLTYINMPPLASGYAAPDRFDWPSLQQARPLLSYAAIHWARHCRALGPALAAPDTAAVLSFLTTWTRPRHGAFGAWVQCLNPRSSTLIPERTQPPYYIASYGLPHVLPQLLAHAPLRAAGGLDLNAGGGRFLATPVRIATFRGHYGVARALVDAGAAPPFAACVRHDKPCAHGDAALPGDARASPGLQAHVAQLLALMPARAGEAGRRVSRADKSEDEVTAEKSEDKPECGEDGEKQCVRLVETYAGCGHEAYAQPVVHAAGAGTHTLLELRSELGAPCPRCSGDGLGSTPGQAGTGQTVPGRAVRGQFVNGHQTVALAKQLGDGVIVSI